MNKKILVALIMLSGYSISHSMTDQTFDFERRYGVDSPVLNTSEYFEENKEKTEPKKKKPKKQNKKKQSKKQGQKTTHSNK